MEISSLTIKLIILLIPGLISYFIYKRITSRANKRSDLMFIAVSVLLGLLSYLCLQLINMICCFIGNLFKKQISEYEVLRTFESISNDSSIPYSEVFFASVCGIIIAYGFAYIDTYNVINKLAFYIKATTKKSDENLFSVYLNKEEIEWVYVRDIQNRLTYLGSIFLFAEKENSKEIVLNDVTVYSYPESIELYSLPSIYLSLKDEHIIIEQAKIEENERE